MKSFKLLCNSKRIASLSLNSSGCDIKQFTKPKIDNK